MIRRVICPILRLALRVFFRRVEVAGAERVPLKSPVIFVLNHPNAMVDPAFLLCLTPRRVSFLAKAPLFTMPVVGYFVRALDSLPVYRHQDAGQDTKRNRETFEQARKLLVRGGTLAICPEGVSHNEPRLRPLKSGTARIALGAASAAGKQLDLKIVPAGLYYTAKKSFRSAALLQFGEPLRVEAATLDADGEPSREAVRELSGRIERALREVMLEAEHDEALATIARAEKIFSSEAEARNAEARNYTEASDDDEPSLQRELQMRRRFVEAYAYQRAHAPERIATLEARIIRYEEELKQAGLDAEDLSAPLSSRTTVIRHLVWQAFLFACLFPIATVGLFLHYPAYYLASYLAVRLSENSDDVVATFGIAAAMLLFPLTWLSLALLVCALVNWPLALVAFIFLPFAGYAAVRFHEELDRYIGGTRALAYFVTRRRFFLQLLAERKAIYEEILALANYTAPEITAKSYSGS
jgi:1-acyl-sn-glycerol-3-phosphate acyltransferase